MSRTIDVLYDMPTKFSSAQSWQLWHKALKSKFGRDKANYTFLEAWQRRGSYAANNEALRLYLKKQGIILDADWKDAAIDFAGNPFGIVDYFTSMHRNMMIAGIVLLVVFLVMVIQVLRNPQGAISLMEMATPVGRAAKLARR